MPSQTHLEVCLPSESRPVQWVVRAGWSQRAGGWSLLLISFLCLLTHQDVTKHLCKLPSLSHPRHHASPLPWTPDTMPPHYHDLTQPPCHRVSLTRTDHSTWKWTEMNPRALSLSGEAFATVMWEVTNTPWLLLWLVTRSCFSYTHVYMCVCF